MFARFSGLLLVLTLTLTAHAAGPAITTARVPGGGVQAQAAADAKGVAHLIYLKGDPGASDIFYVRSTDGAATWSAPIRVNNLAGSAIAMGTVRGAHLALGKDGRPHVAWMGAQKAEPRALGKETPMLYTRLSDDGKSFEPQRNLITQHPGLDGGGSIAADDAGHVYVAWHAPMNKGEGEVTRRVWVAVSDDDGKTFAAERSMTDEPIGGCGCCGMRIATAGGSVFALYRSATQEIHRDIYLMRWNPLKGKETRPAELNKVGPMTAGKCVMSTAAFSPAGKSLIAAWEREEQIEFGRIDVASGKLDAARPVPGKAGARKHPSVAAAKDGSFVIAWAEGTGWNKGGSIAWQAFDADGKPIPSATGTQRGLPAWGTPAVIATEKGFVVLY